MNKIYQMFKSQFVCMANIFIFKYVEWIIHAHGIYRIQTNKPPFHPGLFFSSLEIIFVISFLYIIPDFWIHEQIYKYVRLLLKYKW